MYEIKHYGKPLDNLTNEEKKLMSLDVIVTTMFKEIYETQQEIKKVFLKSVVSTIVEERRKLSLNLLNLKDDDFECIKESFEYIETTQYSYLKFVKDYNYNTRTLQHIEKVSMLN